MLRVRCHACVGYPQKHSPASDKHSVFCAVFAAAELVFGCQMVAVYLPPQRRQQSDYTRPACLHSHSSDSLVTEKETHTHTRMRDRERKHRYTRAREGGSPRAHLLLLLLSFIDSISNSTSVPSRLVTHNSVTNVSSL